MIISNSETSELDLPRKNTAAKFLKNAHSILCLFFVVLPQKFNADVKEEKYKMSILIRWRFSLSRTIWLNSTF